MLSLLNSHLRVDILDPLADTARFGSRYCAGGYIWQVTDAKLGALLSGPAYPAEPPPFDGQGLPEVFEIALGQHTAKLGEDVYVIGAGRVKRESPVIPFHVRNNRKLAEPARWSVSTAAEEVVMASEEGFREWALKLIRRVSLDGRWVTSTTSVINRGGVDLPLRWFAHPFFPHAGLEVCGFSREAAFPGYVPEAGGFRWNARGWLERRGDYDWKKGCYQLLLLPFGYPVDVTQRHPLLGEIKVECRFPLAWMPVWANERTVSFEPYHHTVLAPGARAEWAISYAF